MSETTPTAEFASFVYGGDAGIDDLAETYHEASRLYPGVVSPRTAAMGFLSEPAVAQTLGRASRIGAGPPDVVLSRGRLPEVAVGKAIERRLSALPDVRTPLDVELLGCLLNATVAVRSRDGLARRPVASAGALYPLETYILPFEVEGLPRHVAHYDPFRHGLAFGDRFDDRGVEAALVDPSIAGRAAALVVVTSVFWRTRVKYGLRGYRFALLEAGHVVQALTTVATALDVPSLPLGGYYDAAIDELVGADGVDEATVYVLALGGR